MPFSREKQQYIFIQWGWTDHHVTKHRYIYMITSQVKPSLKVVSHLKEKKHELNVNLNASFCNVSNFCFYGASRKKLLLLVQPL